MDDKQSIIIDAGTLLMKVGFAGEEAPRAVFPTVIGRPKYRGITFGSEVKDYLVGAEAAEKRGILELSYPLQSGVVEDWDDFEKILNHIFTYVLFVRPGEQNVIILMPPQTSASDRERLAYTLFHYFSVPGLFIASGPACAIYAAGKFTGLVVDIGASALQVVPVFDGHALPGATLRTSLAGNDLTAYLGTFLEDQGVNVTGDGGKGMVEDIKETCCRVALNFQAEREQLAQGGGSAVTYELPGGEVLSLGIEQLQVPEALFTPSLIGREFGGVAEQVQQSISRCDVELQRDLWHNIVLTGGSSRFPGLPERLEQELKNLAPAMAKFVKVHAIPNGQYGAWLGASILASTSSFGTSWITDQEYQAFGADVVRWKCF